MISAALAALLLAMPNVGETAPSFAAEDCDGKPVALAQLLSEGPVILAFFPKARTPGCTQELKNYQALMPKLVPLKARVVAISQDDAATLRAFRGDLGASYTFVPDPQGKLIRLFDVRQLPTKMAKRVTFLVRPNGSIAKIARGREAIDPAEMLEAAF